MAPTHSSIATDSQAALHKAVGDDATATFEDDPKFIESDPTGTASSENVAAQRDDSEDGLEDVDAEDEDDEYEDDDTDDEDTEDEDTEDEDIEDDDDESAAEEEDEEDEEDVDVDSAARRATLRTAAEADDDAGDVGQGIDEDEVNEDDLDTVRVADPPGSTLSGSTLMV